MRLVAMAAGYGFNPRALDARDPGHFHTGTFRRSDFGLTLDQPVTLVIVFGL